VDVRRWGPGDSVFEGNLYVPENLPRALTTSELLCWILGASSPLYVSQSPVATPTAGTPKVKFRSRHSNARTRSALAEESPGMARGNKESLALDRCIKNQKV
jgi:hypothetical protein